MWMWMAFPNGIMPDQTWHTCAKSACFIIAIEPANMMWITLSGYPQVCSDWACDTGSKKMHIWTVQCITQLSSTQLEFSTKWQQYSLYRLTEMFTSLVYLLDFFWKIFEQNMRTQNGSWGKSSVPVNINYGHQQHGVHHSVLHDWNWGIVVMPLWHQLCCSCCDRTVKCCSGLGHHLGLIGMYCICMLTLSVMVGM